MFGFFFLHFFFLLAKLIFTSLGQANKRVGSKEWVLPRLAGGRCGFIVRHLKAKDSPFCPAEIRIALFTRLSHPMPFPTDGKETIVTSRSWLCWWGSTVLSRQVPALWTVQHPTAPQHLKKGRSGALGWGPVPGQHSGQPLSSSLKPETYSCYCRAAFLLVPSVGIRSLKPLTHQFG